MTEPNTNAALLANALELSNALKGLYAFTNLKLCKTNVSVDDLNALNGLVFVIMSQTEVHVAEMSQLLERTTD